MSKMNVYANKDGYKIRATEKAYNLYYKKQGFQLVTDKTVPAVSEEEAVDSDENKTWTVASLKEALNEAGIEYPKNATKAELLELLTAREE